MFCNPLPLPNRPRPRKELVIKITEGRANPWHLMASQSTAVAEDHTGLVTYLIEVDHDIALRPSAALDIL